MSPLINLNIKDGWVDKGGHKMFSLNKYGHKHTHTKRERERETLHIHRLCMTGLRRVTPIYPKKRKKENCISENLFNEIKIR
jgi:hypothetical protein